MIRAMVSITPMIPRAATSGHVQVRSTATILPNLGYSPQGTPLCGESSSTIAGYRHEAVHNDRRDRRNPGKSAAEDESHINGVEGWVVNTEGM